MISLLQDILPSIEAAAQARRPLVITAEDVDGEALAACILNKLCGQLQQDKRLFELDFLALHIRDKILS